MLTKLTPSTHHAGTARCTGKGRLRQDDVRVVAVEEWLAQQRADAEARARMWQLFGPAPSPARIEEVRHWLDEQR